MKITKKEKKRLEKLHYDAFDKDEDGWEVIRKETEYKEQDYKICAVCDYFVAMAEPSEGFDVHGECYLVIEDYPAPEVRYVGICKYFKTKEIE